MRPLEETRARWRVTAGQGQSTADVRRAARGNESWSPCLSGCRSVCWKAFLLSADHEAALDCAQAVRDGRRDYDQRRGHFFKYIEHPEALRELVVDPLADDADSPWNTLRQDELMRAEIRQDVQRLPDEANYHDDGMQRMILDILFVYCKANPHRGGYRQGMHELLAPMVHVVEQDAMDPLAVIPESAADESMAELLDASFVEHDAYVLFSRLMERAQAFYEISDAVEPRAGGQTAAEHAEQPSAIVERSKFIHEVCLQKFDQELATHLTMMEVLPQIFLIRWIRLLFSREFPFDQSLALWDAIFAIDPSLDLMDFICCAMLIRIRWQLLEADYSACLQLLLKYPPPQQPFGPHTLVDDAVFLRDEGTEAGGVTLIEKYTGRRPGFGGALRGPRASADESPTRGSRRQLGASVVSSLPSPPKFVQQQGGIESLFQGAAKSAKGVLERGEKLGINQAVRDAMVEIRRNVQNLNETRQSMRGGTRQLIGEDGAARALAMMERRNKQLASLLDETVTGLKSITASDLGDSGKRGEMLELAAARIQFVQVYLEEASMEVPIFRRAGFKDGDPEAGREPVDSRAGMRGEVQSSVQAEDEASVADAASKPLADADTDASNLASCQEAQASRPDEGVERSSATEGGDTRKEGAAHAPAPGQRRAATPTRSTLAQSSFSWMLEPDMSAPAHSCAPPARRPASTRHKKKLSSSGSRERNAFLFGELAAETDGNGFPRSDNMFGMEPMRRPT